MIKNLGLRNGLYFMFSLLRPQGLLKIRVGEPARRVFLRLNTSDIDVFEQVFINSEYDLSIYVDFSVNKILDCGSNIGLTSIFFLQNYPMAKIVCLEPDEENFELLVKNTRPGGGITELQIALWKDNLGVSLLNNQSNDSFQTSEILQNSLIIPSVTLSSLFEKYGTFDIIKMDIEGAEKVIFTYLKEGVLEGVKLLVIETHDRHLNGCTKALFDYLSRDGREYNVFTQGELLIIKF